MKQRQLGTNGPSSRPSASAAFPSVASSARRPRPTACAPSMPPGTTGSLSSTPPTSTAKGVSETVIGKWLKTRRPPPAYRHQGRVLRRPNRRIDNRPEYLRAELEGSLKRLGVDHVTLFYAHRHDPQIPAEDLAGTMQRLQEEGKILGYGLSEIGPYTLERAHAVHPVMAVQNEYSLWTRQPELGLIQRCASLGRGFRPLLAAGARGLRHADGRPGKLCAKANSAPAFPASTRRTGRTTAPGCKPSMTWPTAAASPPPRWPWPGFWTAAPHIIPIPGTRSADHLQRLGRWRPRSTSPTTTVRRSTASFPPAGPGATATTTSRPRRSNVMPDRGSGRSGSGPGG